MCAQRFGIAQRDVSLNGSLHAHRASRHSGALVLPLLIFDALRCVTTGAFIRLAEKINANKFDLERLLR
jgi:hypothetical protein